MLENQRKTTRFNEEQRFRLLIDAVVDYAIYMTDPSGIITSWNSGARRLKGYEESEILGQHFSRFYTEQDRAAGLPQQALDTAVREGRFEGEGWRVRKDGTRFMAHVVIDAIRSDTGTLLGFAKITRDITDATQAKLALEQAREALFQSQKLQAIGQLTGGIAHDFNNLLTVILGNLEIVRKRLPADPKLAQLLDNATQGAQRGVYLTQRMLAFARRQKLAAESVELSRLVQGISGLLQSSMGPSIDIQAHFTEPLSPVLADVNQLELAILNLATNARDAMPQGGRIEIAARERQGDELGPDASMLPGRYVCLSITDEGEGMDEATLASAVDPFFTTKGVGKGTGLGLSMVHGLAEQLGGRLVLKSRKGVGTRAELWLPVAMSSTPGKVPSAQATAPSVNELLVLVVDDDSLVLTSTRLLLEDLGHRVLCASSGVQALETYEHNPGIDMVITDMAMPQMDGAHLAKLLRDRQPSLPIVLATGYAERLEGFATQLPRLTKPFKQIDLVQIIGQTMK
ncbi:ATP-binding protein [Pseudomonas citri]|uniref:ATP-binding protein n=1 Tax=Pseudomonas citri TaxID=2978349 RepID=UPI0021B6C2B1|nr:ATP-binding protein [Pseudomonas citri]